MFFTRPLFRYDITEPPQRGIKILNIDLAKEGYLLFDSSEVSRFPGCKVTMEFYSNIPVKETMQSICQSDDSSDSKSIKSAILQHRIDLSRTTSQKPIDNGPVGIQKTGENSR